MSDLKMVSVSAQAARMSGHAMAVYWVKDEPTERHLRSEIDEAFRELATSLGYRVERIGDGINTGKPVVAGGV